MHIETITRIIDICLEEVDLISNFSLMAINKSITANYICPIGKAKLEIQAKVQDDNTYEIEIWSNETTGIQSYVKTTITNLINVLQCEKNKLLVQNPTSLK
jgi:hypothetical protein